MDDSYRRFTFDKVVEAYTKYHQALNKLEEAQLEYLGAGGSGLADLMKLLESKNKK